MYEDKEQTKKEGDERKGRGYETNDKGGIDGDRVHAIQGRP